MPEMAQEELSAYRKRGERKMNSQESSQSEPSMACAGIEEAELAKAARTWAEDQEKN